MATGTDKGCLASLISELGILYRAALNDEGELADTVAEVSVIAGALRNHGVENVVWLETALKEAIFFNYRQARTENDRGRLHHAETLVYVAKIKNAPLYKIGATTNLDRRMKEIANMVPQGVVVIGTAPGGTGYEARLHRQFKAFREAGEWFRLPPNQAEMLEDMIRQARNDDT